MSVCVCLLDDDEGHYSQTHTRNPRITLHKHTPKCPRAAVCVCVCMLNLLCLNSVMKWEKSILIVVFLFLLDACVSVCARVQVRRATFEVLRMLRIISYSLNTNNKYMLRTVIKSACNRMVFCVVLNVLCVCVTIS